MEGEGGFVGSFAAAIEDEGVRGLWRAQVGGVDGPSGFNISAWRKTTFGLWRP